MIRLARCHRADQAGEYFRLHLLPGDHPERPVVVPFPLRARWVGSALPLLGLGEQSGPSAGQLVRLCGGLHPDRRLRLAPAVNRTRAYYDLTVAAPKSVSLAALLRPDHPTAVRVLQAHLGAVRSVAQAAGVMMQPRSGSAPGQWLGALFTHTHTREGDPHLHSHLIVPNLMRNAEGHWRALQVVIAGEGRRQLGLRYAHELSRGLQDAGLGSQLVLRANVMPEIAPLRPLAARYSRARGVLLRAERAATTEGTKRQERASVTIPPTERSRPAPTTRQATLRRRQWLADRLRRVKPKGADDPAGLESEARRWRTPLATGELHGVLRLLDAASATDGIGGVPLRLLRTLPPAAADVVTAACSRLALAHGVVGAAELWRETLRASAGRHPWEELERACQGSLRARNQLWARLRAEEGEELPRLVAAMAELGRVASGVSSSPAVETEPAVATVLPATSTGRRRR